MARKQLIEERLDKLVGGFGGYVSAYDQPVPFSSDQLAAHQACLALRRQAESVRAAVSSEAFLASLRRTLIAWGIGGRGSYLVSGPDFARALQAALPALEAVEPLTIDAPTLPSDIADQLWLIIDSLGVAENKAKIVAGTKTLHHLLPDLVPPMDRAWTGLFFQLHAPEWQDLDNQRRTFRRVYGEFVHMARRVQPQQYVTAAGWRTCRAKILDNALIGYCKVEISGHQLPRPETGNAVSFAVEGYPPSKNEAKSMLASEHKSASRVRLLLAAAQQACLEQSFVAIEEGDVVLEVVIRATAEQPTWDATNYLGGIADVLESKAWRGPLDHLGELASVWLYRDDRQIKEVSYQEIASDRAGYTVTVRRRS